MKATIRLGNWFGVPVGLHYSWFIIAWLITLSLVSQFSAQNAGWSAATIWGLSVATAGLFFVCRSCVIGDPEAPVSGGRVQRLHVDVNEAGQRLKRSQRVRVGAKRERIHPGEHVRSHRPPSRIPRAVRLERNAQLCREPRLRERKHRARALTTVVTS